MAFFISGYIMGAVRRVLSPPDRFAAERRFLCAGAESTFANRRRLGILSRDETFSKTRSKNHTRHEPKEWLTCPSSPCAPAPSLSLPSILVTLLLDSRCLHGVARDCGGEIPFRRIYREGSDLDSGERCKQNGRVCRCKLSNFLFVVNLFCSSDSKCPVSYHKERCAICRSDLVRGAFWHVDSFSQSSSLLMSLQSKVSCLDWAPKRFLGDRIGTASGDVGQRP